jgi:FdhD protein
MPLTLPASLPRLTLAQAPLTCEIDAVNEYGEQHKVSIPAERALTVYVDKRELVTLMTLGAHPELLVLGFLRNQRLLKSVHEIESITVDWDVGAAAVKTRHGIEDIEEKTSRRVVTTGCGQGSVFGGLMDEVDQIALPPAAGITQSQLYSLVNTIRLKETTYKSAGSVHACALFDASLPEPEMLLFVEDVGRHNAMDTIAGWMWMKDVAPTLPTSCGSLPLQGATPPEAAHLQAVQARAGGLGAAAFSPEGAAAPAARQSRFRGPDLQEAAAAGQDGVPTLVASPTDLGLEGLVFYTTGRMTSEMVIKSAQMGVPVVVSRSGITQMGHQVAQTVGLCAIGRATNKRFVCYSRAQRLTLQPGLVTKTDVTPDTARQRVSSGA